MDNDVSYLSNKQICMLLASRIKKERIAQNMTQKDFAKKAEVSIDIYRKFEQKGISSLERLIAYVKALSRVDLLQEFLDFEKDRMELDIENFLETRKKRERKTVRKTSNE
jgi:transcriptional regulator with XRE-family HTH domain